MAIQGTLQQAGKKTMPAAPAAPAILCIAAITLISLYSAFAIHRIVASNAPPTVSFTLGTAYRDVPYCNSQTLDIFVPTSAARPLPLAIFVHGAGLIAGDKGYLNPTFLNALATSGFAVASLNYRLAPQNKWPAQIEDVKCGIRYLRTHAQRYGVDPGQIFAFGTSYGGLLVALAAFTGDDSSFDVGKYPNTSSRIAAAVDFFGPADLPGWISDETLHKVFGGNRASLALASPTHYVKANAPPILIVQGKADTTVPESQSVELYQKLDAAGDQTQLVLVRNMGHMFAQVGFQPIDPSLAQIADDMVGWFDRYRAGA
jgi:acetyl esterase/lipase